MITNTIEPSSIITNNSLQRDNIVQDVEPELANLTMNTTSPNHYRARSDHLETIPEDRKGKGTFNQPNLGNPWKRQL